MIIIPPAVGSAARRVGLTRLSRAGAKAVKFIVVYVTLFGRRHSMANVSGFYAQLGFDWTPRAMHIRKVANVADVTDS